MKKGKETKERSVRDLHEKKRKSAAAKKSSKELQQEDLYRILAEKSFGGVYVVQEGIFRFLNHHAASYAGYTVEELTGRPAPSIVHPDDKETARKNASDMLKGKRSSPYKFRIIDRSGATWLILETVTSINYEGRPAVLGNSMDITELRNATQKMEEQKALADSIISAIPQAVVVLKKDVIVFASDAVETIFGWKPGEVIGNKVRMFYKSDPDFKDSSRYIRLILEKENICSLESRHRRKDGKEITCMQYNSRIGRNEKNGKIVVIFEDITVRKQAEEALRESEKRYLELSITDGLTKLYNTRHCYNILESEVARSNRFKHPLTMLMMDIDNFKRFNDTHGHMEGDHVLTRFADVIRRSIRKVDYACRYGGEEFIVILPETVADHGIRVAERIRNEFKKEVFIPKEGVTEQVTVSIGVAQLTSQEGSAEFIKRADKRLYKAKEQGKDRVVF